MFLGGVDRARAASTAKHNSTASCATRNSKVYTHSGSRPLPPKASSSRQSSYSEQAHQPSQAGGGLLHRIAEEMLQPAPAKSNNRKGYLRQVVRQ